MIGVTENLRKIRDLLAEAAVEAGRSPEDVHLLAVSKKQPLEKIVAAADAGQRDFGENTVQEGIEKVTKLTQRGLCWHFIGHIQSNKTRAVAEHFDWVHSVDKLKTAKAAVGTAAGIARRPERLHPGEYRRGSVEVRSDCPMRSGSWLAPSPDCHG